MRHNKLAISIGVELNIPQYEFYLMDKQFRAFVGGYRSGKTFLGCVRLCILALSYPGIKLGYFAPTYPQIRDIFYSTIEDVAEMFGMSVSIKRSEHEVTLSYYGDVHALVKCRSMEFPSRIVGFDINHALIDEIDTMKKEKADLAWKKIIARLSSKGFDEQRLYDEELNCELVIEALEGNTVDFTTTPEGFGWVYDLFVKQLRSDTELQKYYGIVHASTKQNAKNLAKGYIESLYATYPANLVEAYINGKFVNLTSGTVYTAYDRRKNNTSRVVRGTEHLHIGMDFNVGKMSAVVHVKDIDQEFETTSAVDEFMGLLDTPAMIKAILVKYPEHKKNQITIYPDASAQNRKSSNASETDVSQLKEHFRVNNKSKNPFVKDRIASVQAILCNANGDIRYFVNEDACPITCESLEQQVYNKQGEPDKTGDNDHPNDALGYYINNQYPIILRRGRLDID